MTNEQKAKQWFDLWADNSDPLDENKGIISYASHVLPHYIHNQYGCPRVHKEMYMKTLQFYNPDKTILQDRQLQFELARDYAKSTIGSFVIPLYIVCYNGHYIKIANWNNDNRTLTPGGIRVKLYEDVILIMSETFSIAENWTSKIRTELSSNKMLKAVFGEMKPQSLKDDQGKWTNSCFRVLGSKGTYSWQCGEDTEVIAKGATQQIRGYNTKGRITFFIADDLYSLKTTLTQETRYKTRYRFTAEAKNGVDSNIGKILSIGTKVHEDTIIVDNETNRRFEVIRYTAMNKEKFEEVLQKFCKINSQARTCLIPTKKECEELEKKGYITYWPQRLSLYLLLSQYSEAFEGKSEGRTLAMFWQEKFHETLSEEDKRFKRHAMRTLNYDLEVINNVLFIKIGDEYRNVTGIVAVDAATSFKSQADDTCIIWALKDFNGRIYFHKIKHGKFGSADEFESIEDQRAYLEEVCRITSKIKRIGTIDEVLRWLTPEKLPYTGIVIETNNIGSEIIRQLNRKMHLIGAYYTVLEQTTTKVDKVDRIIDSLAPFFDAGAVYFKEGEDWETLFHQLEYLGKTSKDDCADAAAIAAANLYKPGVKIDSINSVLEKRNQGSILKRLGILNTNKKHSDVWRI